MKQRTSAQAERQRLRSKSGRYIKNPCYGCGKAAPVEEYYSHRLTDTVAASGDRWGDTALVLCARCSNETDHMNEPEEFREYARENGGRS